MEKKGFIIYIGLFFSLFLFLFLFYSPFSIFRDYFITTSMTTKSHQYLARFFYSDTDILKVIAKNKVIEVNEITDSSKIQINKNKRNTLYRKRKIYGKGYVGYLIEIYSPERVQLATSRKLGVEGETILEVAEREDAIIAMNAVGFYDPNWSSNGAIPHGKVIQDGIVVSDYGTANVGGGFVGFTKEGKLILGKVSLEKILSLGVLDAVEFGPFLIVNGKKSQIVGNGGWGIAPRSAIGQRRDGTVLFLVINGRIPSSIGARMQDLIDIMKENGAYNAANMDGGSSSALFIHQKIINTPVGGGENGLRKLPVFWIVK